MSGKRLKRFFRFGRSAGAEVRASGTVQTDPQSDAAAFNEAVEVRVQLALIEMRSYLDSALSLQLKEVLEAIEHRHALTSLEARAYASDALESVTMGMRGSGTAVVKLSKRIDALEEERAAELFKGNSPRRAALSTKP